MASTEPITDQDLDGRCQWPFDFAAGSPKPVPFKPMWDNEEQNPEGNQDVTRDKARMATENKNFIKTGLRKYVEYWASGMSKCAGHAESIGPYL